MLEKIIMYILMTIIFGGLGASPVIAWIWYGPMIKDRRYHAWPSVTRCRLCDKRIWAWQRYERRQMAMHTDGQEHLEDSPVLAVSVGGSCLVHKSCKGVPEGHISIMPARQS